MGVNIQISYYFTEKIIERSIILDWSGMISPYSSGIVLSFHFKANGFFDLEIRFDWKTEKFGDQSKFVDRSKGFSAD